MAFPWLFRYGKFGLKHVGPLYITPSMYFRVRLYHKDAVFRKDMTYLLHSAVSYDMSLLKSEISIHMKMKKTVNGRDEAVTAGHIKNIGQAQNSELLENSYMFSGHNEDCSAEDVYVTSIFDVALYDACTNSGEFIY